jgi:hypothetical protein
MFRNGIYKIFYRDPADEDGSFEDALAVVRNGKVIGADRYGGVFTGEPRCALGLLETLKLQLNMPPGGELVTGYVAGPSGVSLDIIGRLDPMRDNQTAVVEIGGEPVELVVSYLGPLPE